MVQVTMSGQEFAEYIESKKMLEEFKKAYVDSYEPTVRTGRPLELAYVAHEMKFPKAWIDEAMVALADKLMSKGLFAHIHEEDNRYFDVVASCFTSSWNSDKPDVYDLCDIPAFNTQWEELDRFEAEREEQEQDHGVIELELGGEQ